MNEAFLPHPNKEELTPFNKVEYYNRLYKTVNYDKFGIDNYQFAHWIHLNYISISSGGKPINLKQFKSTL